MEPTEVAQQGLALHPLFNACLNFTSGVLLVIGFVAIKSGEKERHKAFMLGAFGVSTLFLISYVIRFLREGTHVFPGEGLLKVAYLSILFSHMVLAAIVPVLAIGALFFALKRADFERHKKWAKPLFPIWVYVSVTGVIVYWMLYHLT